MTPYETIRSALTSLPQGSTDIPYLSFALLIIASIIMAIACSHLYLMFFDKNSTGSRVYRAFPIMGPAITCIFLTVQFSLPLSLGLLGALSIVRFRTPIKEPEEIGFILLLIACSLSIASFHIMFAVVLFVLVFVTLFVLRHIKGFDSVKHGANILQVSIPAPGKDGIDIAKSISSSLSEAGINNSISSIHSEQDQAYITFKLKKSMHAVFDLLEKIQDAHPTAAFSYHEA
jgi:hypothetical protein